MITIAIISAAAGLIYLFGRMALKMAKDAGEQKKLLEIHARMEADIRKQAEILAEAKTVEQVIDDLESGQF